MGALALWKYSYLKSICILPIFIGQFTSGTNREKVFLSLFLSVQFAWLISLKALQKIVALWKDVYQITFSVSSIYSFTVFSHNFCPFILYTIWEKRNTSPKLFTKFMWLCGTHWGAWWTMLTVKGSWKRFSVTTCVLWGSTLASCALVDNHEACPHAWEPCMVLSYSSILWRAQMMGCQRALATKQIWMMLS